MKPGHLLFSACLLFGCVAANGQGCSTVNDPASHTKAGDRMPDFAVTDTAGHTFSIAALRGKVLLVNFWATWCEPCRMEMPRLEREVWSKFKAENLAMVAIAREQSNQEIAQFEKQTHFTFPLAPDPKRVTYALFADSGIPRSYVVSVDGKILFQTVGYCEQDFNQMEKVLGKALTADSKPVETRQ